MSVKEIIKNTPIFDKMLVNLRRKQLEKLYLTTRESYRASEGQLRYEEGLLRERTTLRLLKKGLKPLPQTQVKPRVLSYIPQFSWHPHLLYCLQKTADVTNFDYLQFGYKQAMIRQPKPEQGLQLLSKISQEFYDLAKAEHQRQPFDLIFVYALGGEIMVPVLARLQAELKIPIVSLCLDDKHCWNLETLAEQNSGMRDIARLADLGITSARTSCNWYLAEGGNPIFMPEGVDVDFFASDLRESEFDSGPDVVFIGELYGFRWEMMRKLARQGIYVDCYGKGSAKGMVDDAQYRKLCRTSKIFLGLAGVGYSETLKNIKGRDFEVVAAGGCYLTTFEPDLSTYFQHRQHLMYYSTDFELIEGIRELLSDKELRTRIRMNGMRSCDESHRWEHRFQEIYSLLRGHSGVEPN